MNTLTTSPKLWALKRQPGYFQYRVEVEPGRVRSFKCRSENEGKRLLKAWIAEQSIKTEQAVKAAQAARSVDGYIRSDWAATKHNLAATTQIGSESLLNVHIYPDTTFCGLDITNIKVHDVQKFIGRIQGSEGTKKRVLQLLHALFEHTVGTPEEIEDGDKSLLRNPIRMGTGRKPRASESEVTALEPTEEAALIKFVAGDPFWSPFCLVSLDAGLRLAEILALRWVDVDWTESKVFIHRTADTLGKHVVIKPRCKNPWSVRRIKVSHCTLTALAARKSQSGAHILDLIFADPNPKHPGEDAFNRHKIAVRFDRVLEQAGIKHYGLHALRHTMACRLLREGKFITAVSKRLGHKDVATTLRSYTNSIPADDEVLASAFDATVMRATNFATNSEVAA